jgi:aldehyde:ferredoxin oxidoreductase
MDGAVRLGRGALAWAAEMTCRARASARISASVRSAVREVRPSRTVDDGQGPGVPGLRPARHPGHGLTYATSNRGACHLRGYTVASEVLGIPEKTDPLVTEGKAGLVKAFQDATAVVDSSGLCVFTTFAWTLETSQPQIDAACEGDWSPERLLEVGERIWNLERDFNMRAGLTGADDNLPKRLLEEPANTGPAEGKVSGLPQMLPEYYQLRGWTGDEPEPPYSRMAIPYYLVDNIAEQGTYLRKREGWYDKQQDLMW